MSFVHNVQLGYNGLGETVVLPPGYKFGSLVNAGERRCRSSSTRSCTQQVRDFRAWVPGDVPVAVVPGLTVGTGYVIGQDSLLVSTDRAGIRAEWGTPGDSFTKNELVARVEGRFSLDAPRPHGVVKLTLTGP
ncbi:hypothetical protein [Oerskovia enterophila]|uniref:Uncharacterized protein n=1 Tax=Oerskovia enterophila TaxID=43678 RepID=A0ABX2Y9L6_9CELL|nr:hypothetical protein [Oerskovia enterophila]OCI32706.1 hypothetical protein OERS_06370 [Oerskovia enterophila]